MYLPGHIFLVFAIFSATAPGGNTRLLGDLPVDIIADIIGIFYNRTARLLGNCSQDEGLAPETDYWLYTRDNPESPQIVTEPNISLIQNRERIIFLAHGWIGNANSSYNAAIKNAYLIRYNAYIVSVDWSTYAGQNYASSVCDIPSVARNVANFICKLKQDFNISLADIHAVGHSLGAQLFGFVGRFVQMKCQEKLGRITGLDPAGPLYDDTEPEDRLDPTDATFVDVIHTTQGQAGYLGSCGHLDVFPNCGYTQPGCPNNTQAPGSLLNITAILLYSVDDISCSHARSTYLFGESINSDAFIARPCHGCGLPVCASKYLSTERKIIGEDCSGPGKVRNYVLRTHGSPPFAEG